jgi:hypothetical protein
MRRLSARRGWPVAAVLLEHRHAARVSQTIEDTAGSRLVDRQDDPDAQGRAMLDALSLQLDGGRFNFRMRLRPNDNYPYSRAASRSVRVRVG